MLRESSPNMTSATTSVSAVRVPSLCKNIQEVNERVYAVLGMHCNTLYPDSSKIIRYVNEHVTQFRVRIGIHGTHIVSEIYM